MGHISIIVPVYQVEQYLYRCIDSILAQTYDDFDLILVDDGSPDQCGTMCEHRATQDSRIVVIHQANRGLSGARNAGIDWAVANSSSQWLFFVDSDDFIHPNTLRLLLDATTHHKTDIAIGGFERTAETLPAFNELSHEAERWNTKDMFLQHNLEAIVAWGKLYRKSLFHNIRYPVGKIHEDEATTYKLLFQCDFVSYVPVPLYGYYTNPDGITGSNWSPKRLDALDAFRERVDFFRKRGDQTLYCHAIECLVNHTASNYSCAKNFPAYRKTLKKQLRRLLLRYHRHFSIMENEWLYDIAFPRVSRPIRSVVWRIRRGS